MDKVMDKEALDKDFASTHSRLWPLGSEPLRNRLDKLLENLYTCANANVNPYSALQVKHGGNSRALDVYIFRDIAGEEATAADTAAMLAVDAIISKAFKKIEPNSNILDHDDGPPYKMRRHFKVSKPSELIEVMDTLEAALEAVRKRQSSAQER